MLETVTAPSTVMCTCIKSSEARAIWRVANVSSIGTGRKRTTKHGNMPTLVYI